MDQAVPEFGVVGQLVTVGRANLREHPAPSRRKDTGHRHRVHAPVYPPKTPSRR
jgi:hypothetical protein